MKKLIGTVAVAAMLATAAFAELNMGAWVRTVVAPVTYNGDDIQSGWVPSWGGNVSNARISFRWTSEDEKVGMMYDLFGDGAGGFGPGDYRAGWYRPAEWVKFMVGHVDNGYTMRSDLCYGSWNWLRPNNWLQDDEGLTFNLGNFDGLQIELFPVEGLQILGRLALPADGGFTDAYKMFEQSTFAAGYTIGNVGTIKVAWNGSEKREYKNKVTGHAAGWKVSYTDKDGKNQDVYFDSKAAIRNKRDELTAAEVAYNENHGAGAINDNKVWAVVNANDKNLRDELDKLFDNADKLIDNKVEWASEVKAKESGEEKYYGDIQAAFDLTAVENLFITVGVKFSLASDKYKELGGSNFSFPGVVYKDGAKSDLFNTFKGAIGASYRILDNLKVSASYAIFLLEQKGKKLDDPAMQVGVGVDVGLTDSLGLSADFRAMIPGNKLDPIYSFFVGVDWGFSGNGQLGIGFEGVVAGKASPAGKATDDAPNYTSSVFPAQADKFSFAVPIKFSYWF